MIANITLLHSPIDELDSAIPLLLCIGIGKKCVCLFASKFSGPVFGVFPYIHACINKLDPNIDIDHSYKTSYRIIGYELNCMSQCVIESFRHFLYN